MRDRTDLNDEGSNPLATEPLREQMQLYESLLGTASDLGIGVVISDVETERFLWVNEAACRIFGRSAAELLSLDSSWEALRPQDRPAADEMLRERLQAESGPRERTVVRKDGTIVEIEVSAKPIDGRIIALIRDITGRKQAEERLRQSEEKFRALAENAKDAIIFADEQGNITYFNPEAERAFGYSAAEVAGRPLTMIMPERFHEAHRQGLRRFLSTGETRVIGRTIELAGRRRDGSEFPLELSLASLKTGEGTLFTGILRDITARKRLEEMKAAFLTAVSHELRTPLTSILGFAQTLERRELYLSPEQRQDLFRRLSANAEKLNRLLSDLLDLDRLSRGILEPQRRPTDVAALVLQLVEDLELSGERRVWVEADPVVIAVDPAKTERIVENLLTNAARHTAPGTPVWVKVHAEGSGVLIAVEDAGPGVPEELRELLFQPFQRGAAVPSESAGMGIGLSLVARFAELHGGRVWVEERRGGGASFRVFLPGGRDEPDSGGEAGGRLRIGWSGSSEEQAAQPHRSV